ncbi:hypothetical protein APSETT444_001027 [Aspergillus pseudonomiae]
MHVLKKLLRLYTPLSLLLCLGFAAPVIESDYGQNVLQSKLGAAYNDSAQVMVLSSFVAHLWAYNWDMFANGILPPGVEFVPMLWGAKMFSGWHEAIEVALASGARYILGFNEPDSPSQANLTPLEAMVYYKEYISPYSSKAKLVSPAVTNGGLNWMRSFMSLCHDCDISIMAVHWYGDTAEDFKTFVTEAIETSQRYNIHEIWITEFALTSAINGGDPSDSIKFLRDVIPWLNSQKAVGRFAYFMCAEGFLLEGESLGVVGKAYTASHRL